MCEPENITLPIFNNSGVSGNTDILIVINITV